MGQYPTLSWVRRELRYNWRSHTRRRVLAAYIIGSEAKRTSGPDSDLDIAVVVDRVRGRTSLQLSSYYHSKFMNVSEKPNWQGRVVDFQFFYPDDPELASYHRIKLCEGRRRRSL